MSHVIKLTPWLDCIHLLFCCLLTGVSITENVSNSILSYFNEYLPSPFTTRCPTSFDICGSYSHNTHITPQHRLKHPKANKLLAHSHTYIWWRLLQFLAWPRPEQAAHPAKRNYLLLSSQMAGRVSFVGKLPSQMMMKNVKASKSANGKRCNRSVACFCPVKWQKDCHFLSFPMPHFPSALMMIKCYAEFLGEASTHFVGQ